MFIIIDKLKWSEIALWFRYVYEEIQKKCPLGNAFWHLRYVKCYSAVDVVSSGESIHTMTL